MYDRPATGRGGLPLGRPRGERELRRLSLWPAVWLLALGCHASAGAAPDVGSDAASPDAAPDVGADAASPDAGSARSDAGLRRALLFTRTTGYRHGSIEPAVAALDPVLADLGLAVERTEDPTTFSDDDLARFSVVVFLMTTGDVLGAPEEAALERAVRSGLGWVGVHSASDTEYDWPFYESLVGAYFAGHPAIQNATVRVEDPTHPSTSHLPLRWDRSDEWYNFVRSPRAEVSVLLSVDEATYSGGTMPGDHPICWHSTIERGRTFYTAMGHTDESWSEPAFVAHVGRAIAWAAR